MSNSDSEDLEDPVQLVREPGFLMQTAMPLSQGLLSSSGPGAPKRPGIPIDVPSSQQRTFRGPVHQSHSTTLTGVRTNHLKQKRKSDVSSLSQRNDDFEVVGNVAGTPKSQNDHNKKPAVDVVLLSDEESQYDIKRRRKSIGHRDNSGEVSSAYFDGHTASSGSEMHGATTYFQSTKHRPSPISIQPTKHTVSRGGVSPKKKSFSVSTSDATKSFTVPELKKTRSLSTVSLSDEDLQEEYERRRRQKMNQEDSNRDIDDPIKAKHTKEKTPANVPTIRRRLIDSSTMTASPIISLDPRDSGKPTRKFISSWSRLSQLDQKDDEKPTEKMDKDKGVTTEPSKTRNDSIPTKSSDVVLLSEVNERHDRKTVRQRTTEFDNSNSALAAVLPLSETFVAKMKRQPIALEHALKKTTHSPYTSLHKSSATTSESTKDTNSTVDATGLSDRSSHPPGDLSGSAQYPKRVSLLDKVYALGMGTFPQAPLSCVRLGSVFEFENPGMVIQFGPDRLVINTNKSRAKIKHDEIKTFEYNADGAQAIIVIHTTPEATPSILESLHDPVACSARSLKLTLFSKDNIEIILEQCKKIAKRRVHVKALSSEDAEKILDAKFERTPASATNPSAGSKLEPKAPTPPPSLRADKHDGTLFMFPFKGSARSKPIAVHAKDLDRLKNDEQLNDTLIEFGLKHVYANLQTTDPELADKTHMFNSFFYERLLSKNGKGIQYDAVKSWTNKTDLFSKKYIIVPINENYHWYLAIITNPGLLLKSTGKSNRDDNSNKDVEGKSPSPLTRGSSADAPSPPADSATTTSPSSPRSNSPAKFLSRSSGDADTENSKDALQNLLFPGASRMATRATHGKQDDSAHFRRSLRSSSTSLPLLPIDPEEKPYIIVLDSLGGRHPAVNTRLRAYLQQELLTRKNIERTIDSKVLPGKQGKCPEQDNFSDCGLFLLHYAEVFLKHPGPLLDGMVNMRGGLDEYWDVGELSDKRQQYVAIMESLAIQYQDNLISQKNGERSSSTNQETDQSRPSTPQAHSQQTQSRPSSPRARSGQQKHHHRLAPKS